MSNGTSNPANVTRAQFSDAFERNPTFDVKFNIERLSASARDGVFQAVMDLDIDEACAAIARGEIIESQTEEPVFVGADEGTPDQPILTLIIGALEVDIAVKVDPAQFDRKNPNHEELLQRCARLVQAIHQSPVGDDAGNPVYERFRSLRWTEHVDSNEMIARWARLAEIWIDASKPA